MALCRGGTGTSPLERQYQIKHEKRAKTTTYPGLSSEGRSRGSLLHGSSIRGCPMVASSDLKHILSFTNLIVDVCFKSGTSLNKNVL